MKGSTSGRRRSNSSALVINIDEVKEFELAVPAWEAPGGFELQENGDEPVLRVEDHLMQHPLSAGAVARRIRRQGQLKGSVQLHAFTASQRILHDHPPGAD